MPAFEHPNSMNADAQDAKPKQRRRWPRRLAIGLVILLVLCVGGFALYVSDYYHASETDAYLPANAALSVAESDSFIAIGASNGTAVAADEATEHQDTSTSQLSAETGIVFYPGAKVDPHAYVPLAVNLAERGMLCVIVKAPFNLAFFSIDAAADIMDGYPEVDTWWVGGHSLGGVAASQFAANHADALEGVILLASYSASDLSSTDLRVLQAYGTEDLVLNRESMEKNAGNLPDAATTLVIEGGNHAGFGDYGPQAGDGEAAISAEDQQEETANAIKAFVAPDTNSAFEGSQLPQAKEFELAAA